MLIELLVCMWVASVLTIDCVNSSRVGFSDDTSAYSPDEKKSLLSCWWWGIVTWPLIKQPRQNDHNLFAKKSFSSPETVLDSACLNIVTGWKMLLSWFALIIVCTCFKVCMSSDDYNSIVSAEITQEQTNKVSAHCTCLCWAGVLEEFMGDDWYELLFTFLFTSLI